MQVNLLPPPPFTINNCIIKQPSFYRYKGSARPEIRRTAEPHGKAYPPSGPPRRTPSRHSSLPHCGRTGRA